MGKRHRVGRGRRHRTVVYGPYEWDEEKAALNLMKHGVSFYEGADALAGDPHEIAEPDLTHPENVISLAMSPRERVLYVVTTPREDRTRIIGARKADRNEKRRYAAQED